jgi:phosphoribosyl 1,2-cyclic phosphate phosphodiesterase
MRVTILGCGSSMGVPMPGCSCKVCSSQNDKNKRLRSSILIENININILIDTGPDLRCQLLQYKFKPVHAVLYTHAHADHCVGFNDLRCFNVALKRVMPIYGSKETMTALKRIAPFVFTLPNDSKWSKCCLEANEIKEYEKFNIDDVSIQTFEQIHGNIKTTGYIINKVAYLTDLNLLPEKSLKYLRGKVKILIINCLRHKPSYAHNNLESALHWINEIQPEQAILTHMSHEIDYEEVQALLPKNVRPAYDGMELNI